jgi:ABC-type transport system substrate-binding protein
MRTRWVYLTLVTVVALAVLAGSGSAGPAGATLRIYIPGDAFSLDPAVASDFPTAISAYITHLRLVRVDKDGKIQPMGARSWTVTGGGLVYVFELDPRARFHNGRPVTAEDWKWTFDRLARPETRSGGAPAILGGVVGFDAVRRGETDGISGVRVLGPARLQIVLRPEGRGGFLNRVSHYAAAVLNRQEVESGGATWFERTSAGAGAFRLTRWERNSRFVYSAHPGFVYGPPGVETLEMAIVPSATTRLNLYDAGNLDITDVPLPDYRRVSSDARYQDQLKVFPRAQVLWLGLNPGHYEAFRDARVRRAIAHAIDRDRIARTVFFGFYTPARHFAPPQVSGTDPNFRGLDYDPERAKRLLAESGWAGRLPPLEMPVNPAAPDYQIAGEAIAAMLKETLGLDVRIQRQETVAWSTGLVRRTHPSMLAGWTAAYLDYGYYLDLLLDSRSGLNFTNYRNPEFDKLIDEANSARSEEEREAIYRRAEKMAIDDAHVIPIVFTRFALLVKPYVTGFEGAPLNLGITDFWKLGRR